MPPRKQTKHNSMNNSKKNPAAAAFIADVAKVASAKVQEMKSNGRTPETSGALREWTRILEAAKNA
jgi:predicted transcriptional regulator